MNKHLTSTLLSLTLLLVQGSAARAQSATGGPTPTVLPPTWVPLNGSATQVVQISPVENGHLLTPAPR